MNGKIMKVVEDKGFGFINGEDNKQYFFHQSGLVNRTDWQECSIGRSVTFEPTNGPKGLRAEDVMVL